LKHVAPNISFISHVSTYRLKLVEGLLADRHVLVPLLEPVVLLDVVKVITPEIALHVRSEGKIWSLRCEELRKSKPLKMLISKSSQIF